MVRQRSTFARIRLSGRRCDWPCWSDEPPGRRLPLTGLGSALAVLAALAGCTAEPNQDWGPLAVVDDSGSTGDESGRTIRFEGAEGAVDLRNGTEVTLVGRGVGRERLPVPTCHGCPGTQFWVSDVQVG